MRPPHGDITRAHTPDPALYHSPSVFRDICERVFPHSWHFVGHASEFVHRTTPISLLPGTLDEPLILVQGERRRLLSNVCTHRGMVVCQAATDAKTLQCRYHGRTFDTDGRFKSMPEFEGAADFPSAADDLRAASLHDWRGFLFGALEPSSSGGELFSELTAYVGFLPIESGAFDPASERTYDVAANWVTYADNYLEGFHVPYVHPGLAKALDYRRYRTTLFKHSVLQTGVASVGDDCVFDLPEDHPDAGQRIAGYYAWLFPTTMLNFYPWGISVNLIEPQGPARTRVRYRAWVWDASLRAQGAGASLDTVELEDDAVVEATQRGVSSWLYQGGRYSPKRERGVHHFHRLLAAALPGSLSASRGTPCVD